MSSCERCGQPLQAGARFCASCGAPVVDAGAPSAPTDFHVVGDEHDSDSVEDED